MDNGSRVGEEHGLDVTIPLLLLLGLARGWWALGEGDTLEDDDCWFLSKIGCK